MNKSPSILLFICGAGSQLSWLYAWASFLLFSFFNRIYPLPETVGFFSLAAILTVICRRRRWRMIQIIGIHLAGVVVAGGKVFASVANSHSVVALDAAGNVSVASVGLSVLAL